MTLGRVSLGTLPSFRTEGDGLGVHPAVEQPPHELAEWDPEHILVGHGTGIHEEAVMELTAALESTDSE
jgi:hypothetical protein